MTAPAPVLLVLIVLGVALGAGALGWWAGRRRLGPASDAADARPDEEADGELLAALYRNLRTRPIGLRPLDVLRAVVAEAGVELDAAALLVGDEGGRDWRLLATEGEALPSTGSIVPVESSLSTATDGVNAALGPGGGLLLEHRGAGLGVRLPDRGGGPTLLVLERREPRAFGGDEARALERTTGAAAVALSTARSLSRLRELGAGVERERIGAQLHDQLAQSLAYVGLELDRALRRHPDDGELADVRDVVRGTSRELRETLRTLRLRCTPERGIDEVLTEHLAHVEERSGVRARVRSSPSFRRPPPLIEDQLLRLAVDLVELRSRSERVTSIMVLLTAEPGRARLVVRDDGGGERLDPDADSAATYAALRERAAAIDALVDVLPRPGYGTEVAVTVRDVAGVPRWM